MVTLNPFTYGNPISDPERFVGRRREVEQIFMRLRNPEFESSSIVGERRSGTFPPEWRKSSSSWPIRTRLAL